MKNLYAALLKAQVAMPALIKDATNPAFRSSYATLAQVQEAAFPALHANGLLVMQSARTDFRENGALVVCVSVALVHAESGELTNFELALPPSKTDPQGIGSALTYGRRYALMTLLGLAPDDDDGNAASGQGATGSGRQAVRLEPKPAGKPAPAQAGRPQWKSSKDAKAWGMAQGVFKGQEQCDDVFVAVVRGVVGERKATGADAPAIYDAWHSDVVRRVGTNQQGGSEVRP
jgi:hypothetical protein